MKEVELDLNNESVSDLYDTYIRIVSLIDELEKNIKELPQKEVI